MEIKSDIEIAQSCEMKNIREIAATAGVDEKYLEPVLAWLADTTGKGGSGHGHVGTEFDGKL